jgi:hypothetical protein
MSKKKMEEENNTSEDDNVVLVDADDSQDDKLQTLGSIFDDDMVETYYDAEGRQRWRCKWCDKTFAALNATKAIRHLNKIAKDIRPCLAAIDTAHKERYAEFMKASEVKRNRVRQSQEYIDLSIDSHNIQTAAILDERRSVTSSTITTKRSKITNDSFSSSISNSCFTPSNKEIQFNRQTGSNSLLSTATGSSSQQHQDTKDKKSYFQQKIVDVPNPTVESKLTMAIADMIHSLGLPFSLASDPKFLKVLKLAKASSSQYVPPNRNQVSGELLDLNYKQNQKNNLALLSQDVGVFGLTYFGDGATVKKTPFVNILASGPHLPVAVLDIVDTSFQCEEGKKKDAKFIASLFRPHIDAIEANYPDSTDVLFFDGASNVQLAGSVIGAKYSRTMTLHGSEHVISLFFNDIFGFPQFKALYRIARRAYRVFGSGSMHAPYAIFQKYSKLHNGGKNIGLMRAAGTRMAGAAIVMMRFIRLKKALISTVTSAEFQNLKVKKYFVSYIACTILIVTNCMMKRLLLLCPNLSTATICGTI